MPSSCQSFLSPVLHLTFQQFGIPQSQITWHLSLPCGRNTCLAHAVLFISFVPFALLPVKLTWATEMKRLHCVTEKKNVRNQDVPVAGTFSLIFSCCKNLWHLYARTRTPLPILYCPLCYHDCVRLKTPEGRVPVYGLLSKALCMPGLLF